MSRKQDPAATVVEFFETAPIETAHTVLKIAVSILKRRQPKATGKVRPIRGDQPLLDDSKATNSKV